jgi:hypothetical protein
MTGRIEPSPKAVLYSPKTPCRRTMPNPRPLTWLLALLLCWQGVAVAVASPLLIGGSELRGEHHAGMAPADCARHPEHCQRADSPGPDHCGQQCLHCPAPAAAQVATALPALLPAPASPPAAVATRAPPHPGFEIYRPPAI